MCGQWGEHGIYKDYDPTILKSQLSQETIKRIINEVRDFNPTITLFGGEPMLYKDWILILKYVKNKGLRCNIVTNGVLLSRYAEEIVKYRLDEIIFSLDGPKEIHDNIKRVPHTFEKTMEGFMRLKEIKMRDGVKKPFVTINSTINEFNYYCLEKLISIAEKIGAYHLNIHHLLFLNNSICDEHNSYFKNKFGVCSRDWNGFCLKNLPRIDIDLLLKQMKIIRKRKTGVSVSFYPNFTEDEIRAYYSRWRFKAKSYANRCLSPWMVAYIFPDGSVKPYHTMDYISGNVHKNTFKEIWNNEKYKKFRREVKRIKKFSICSKACTELYRY